MERHASLPLGSLTLRRSRIMDAHRMEVVGFEGNTLNVLKALGCRTEIINWKTRAFVPLSDPGVLDALLDRFQPTAAPSRAAA